MADLEQLLTAALRSDAQAEARLQEYVTNNFQDLLPALAQLVANETKDLTVRQGAAIYIKNLLNGKSAKTQSQYHERWKTTPSPVRQVVKEQLQLALRSPTVAHFSAVTVAEIAAVELPFGAWPEFLDMILHNVQPQQQQPEQVQVASLECLGYTCERIQIIGEMIDEGMPELSSNVVDSMLTTIVDAVQKNRPPKMRIAALQALKNSLAFVHKNMQVKSERDYIMNCVCEATQAPESELKALAFASMDLMADLYYEVLGDYMTVIFDLTSKAIRNSSEEEEVKSAAVEFWSTLATAEQYLLDAERDAQERGVEPPQPKCPRYTAYAVTELTPLLLQLLTQQDEDAQEDEFTLSAAAAVCLTTISQTVEADIVPHVMPFITQNIANQDWHFRDAAVVAFACILEGPSTADVGQYVAEALPHIARLFNDPNMIVRESAIFCISIIAKNHMAAVQQEALMQVLNAIMEKLSDSPRIASKAAEVVYHVATHFKCPGRDRPDSNMLSQGMRQLLSALLAAFDRPDADESNLRTTVMNAVGELIAAAATDMTSMLIELLPALVDRFQKAMSLQVMSAEELEMKNILLGMIGSLFQVIFLQLTKEQVPSHMVDTIVGLLIQGLQARHNVADEDIFMALGAIASVIEKDFSRYLPTIMPFMLQGLQNFEASSTCTVTIGVVVDFCGAVGSDMQPYCDDMVRVLSELLKESSIDRSIKPLVISCFGDIAMAINAAFDPYLSMVVMLLMQAAQLLATPDDEDMLEFINSLRVSILEAYSAILIGMYDGNALNKFLPTLPGIFQFLEYLSRHDSYRDDEVLRAAVVLLGDVAQYAGPHVKQSFQQPFVSSLIQEAQQGGDEELVQNANYALHFVQAVFQQ